jgi:hypothetical protein
MSATTIISGPTWVAVVTVVIAVAMLLAALWDVHRRF